MRAGSFKVEGIMIIFNCVRTKLPFDDRAFLDLEMIWFEAFIFDLDTVFIRLCHIGLSCRDDSSSEGHLWFILNLIIESALLHLIVGSRHTYFWSWFEGIILELRFLLLFVLVV